MRVVDECGRLGHTARLRKRSFWLTLAFVSCTATACSNDRLLFASATTFGLKISVAPEQPQPLNIAVGYDQYDVSVVPTTYSEGQSPLFSEERLCKTKDSLARECEHLFPDAGRSTRPVESSSVSPASSSSSTKPAGAAPSAVQEGVGSVPMFPNALPSSAIGSTTTAGVASVKILEGAAIGGGEYRREPPTTLSVFKADGGAGTTSTQSANFGIDKLFATGVAAQNISQGISYERAGRTSASIQDCAKKLSEALPTLTVVQVVDACEKLNP